METIERRQREAQARYRAREGALEVIKALPKGYKQRTAGVPIPEQWRARIEKAQKHYGLPTIRQTLLLLIFMGLSAFEDAHGE